MADITLNEIRLRRSFDPGYRPGMAGSEALKPGEPFVNLADRTLSVGSLDGAYVEIGGGTTPEPPEPLPPPERSGAVNLLDGFVTEVELAAGTNVAPKIAQAAAFARANGRKALFFPGHPNTYVMNGPTVDLSGLKAFGLTTRGVRASNIRTETAVTTFSSDTSGAVVEGLGLEHYGASGYICDLLKSEGHLVQGCTLVSSNGANNGAMVRIGGSNSHVDDCQISNFSPSQYSVIFTRTSAGLLINSGVRRTYLGGPGCGIGVGAADGQPRPEGIVISECESVLTGGPLIEVSSVLSLRIVNNMIDQGHALGAIRMTPQGDGIQGVNIVGNYISNAAAGNQGAAIVHAAHPTLGLDGVMVTGNEFAFSNTGAVFGRGANLISFEANYFHELATGISVALFDGAQAKFGASNLLGPGVAGLTTIGA